MTVTALIPVKDEPDLGPFLREVRHHVTQVCVVDDSRVWGDLPGVFHLTGAGSLGGSLLSGLHYWHESDRVVTIDAGWSHDPDEIPYLLADTADVVIGSRFCPGGVHEGPWWRRSGSQAYARAWQLRTGQSIQDWTSGFRAYSHPALQALHGFQSTTRGHGVQAEILHYLLDLGFTVSEVPITYRVMPGSTLSWPVVREACGVLVR